jgi:hypothetical protein
LRSGTLAPPLCTAPTNYLWQGVDNELDTELVELTSEISLKQKLIEELEMSQKRMEVMKSQYENKLQVRALGAVEMPQKRMEVMKSHKRIS